MLAYQYELMQILAMCWIKDGGLEIFFFQAIFNLLLSMLSLSFIIFRCSYDPSITSSFFFRSFCAAFIYPRCFVLFMAPLRTGGIMEDGK